MPEDSPPEPSSPLLDDNSIFVTRESLLEQKLGATEIEQRMQSVHIETDINEYLLSAETKELIPEVIVFAKKTSVLFQENMRTLMTHYQQENAAFTEDMQQRMIDKGYDSPKFKVLNGKAAQQLVEEVANMKSNVGEDSEPQDQVVLVFNLPAPLGRFWYRGGTESWGAKGVEIPEDNIEWGHFYREIMPTIWDSVGEEECEGSLNFSRVNKVGQHTHSKYYYVWRVTRPVVQEFDEEIPFYVEDGRIPNRKTKYDDMETIPLYEERDSIPKRINLDDFPLFEDDD